MNRAIKTIAFGLVLSLSPLYAHADNSHDSQKEKQVSDEKKTSEQKGKEEHQHSINHEGREPGAKGKY
ncbi:hypothetical protein [Candidatus Odyssella thessalonicensis]|uniref:hypothetical protein n=1 Tax=Candidatus Odyssella thessalonicensis TaxID=84647 RepID=UPI000225AA11|nr:hypothetical protein [Candidatus Odyssella thessalonicensis]